MRKRGFLENVQHLGHSRPADAAYYRATKDAMLAVLPDAPPGPTVAKLHSRVPPHLPRNMFPDGAKAGWWVEALQLDPEAKGVVFRERTRPLRLHKV